MGEGPVFRTKMAIMQSLFFTERYLAVFYVSAAPCPACIGTSSADRTCIVRPTSSTHRHGREGWEMLSNSCADLPVSDPRMRLTAQMTSGQLAEVFLPHTQLSDR